MKFLLTLLLLLVGLGARTSATELYSADWAADVMESVIRSIDVCELVCSQPECQPQRDGSNLDIRNLRIGARPSIHSDCQRTDRSGANPGERVESEFSLGNNTRGNGRGSMGLCFRGVRSAFERIFGMPLPSANRNAYSAQLLSVRNAQGQRLFELLGVDNIDAPPGSICVIRGGSHGRGHIELVGRDAGSDGLHRRYSDFNQNFASMVEGDRGYSIVPTTDRPNVGCFGLTAAGVALIRQRYDTTTLGPFLNFRRTGVRCNSYSC